MSTITWLHLSDLHFRSSQTYDRNIVLKTLLEDIAQRVRNDSLQPDFIVISGDIAFSSRPEEYNLATKFLDDLLKTTNLPKERLFLVPGNHDVDRNAISPLTAKVASLLNSRDAVHDLLSHKEDRGSMFRRFHHYQEFVNKYFGKECPSFDNTHYFYTQRIPITNLNIVVLGLNSSWLAASDEDRHRLVLGSNSSQLLTL
jgi:predicted MPP superfamily phosphohydrolase